MSRAVARGFLIIVFASIFLAGFDQRSEATPPGCSERDLSGPYGLLGSGTLLVYHPTTNTYTPDIQVSYLGILDFDGQGAIVVRAFQQNGSGFASAGNEGSGNYAVNPDCTGTLVAFDSRGVFIITASIVVVDNGRQVLFVSLFGSGFTPGPASVSGLLKRM